MFVYGSFVTIFLLLHGWCGATRADAAGQDTNTDVKLALIEKDIENIKSVLNAVLKQVQAIGSKQQTIETRQQNMESTLATKIQIVNLRDEKLIQGLNIQVKEMIEKDATLSTKQQAMEAQVSTIYRRLFQLAGSTQQPLSTKSTNCGCKEELSRMNSTGAALHSAMLTEQSAFQSRLTSQLTQLNHTANKCSCQHDIDLLKSTLSNIYKVMNHSWTTNSTGWKLVFKASAGIQKSVFEAWQNPAESSPMYINSLHPEIYHYKSSIVDNWAEQGIKKLLLVLAKDGREVRRFEFNGEGTDKMNWFSARNLLSNSYTDLTGATTTKYFSIVGDDVNHHTSANISRRFFINASYNGCGNDRGWLCVVDNENPVCPWETTGRFPRLLYSPTNTVYRWDNTNVANQGLADVMAIFVKTE